MTDASARLVYVNGSYGFARIIEYWSADATESYLGFLII